MALIIGIHSYGDGQSYYWMTTSLIKDGDLVLDEKDISRIGNDEYNHTLGDIYISIDKNFTIKYGQPVLYSILSSPFVLMFGYKGFSVINGLLFGGCLVFSFLSLRRYYRSLDSLLIVLGFFLCSYIPLYIAWIHTEIMFFFICCLFLWLWLCKGKILSAGFIVGIAAGAKILFLIMLLPLVINLAARKKTKILYKSVIICMLGFICMFLLNYIFLGRLWPYTGVNGFGYIAETSPYRTVEDVRNSLVNFGSLLVGREFNSWNLFLDNIINFFVGRFTGIIWYAFPAIIYIFFWSVYSKYLNKKKKILGGSLILSMFLLVIVLILGRPLDYFGGGGFICNRYFFILPAVLFLPFIKTFKRPIIIAAFFLPGFFMNFHIYNYEFSEQASIAYFRKYSNTFFPGLHTCIAPFKFIPLEIAQIEVLPIPKIKISEDIILFFPLGFKKNVNKKIFLDKGQEIVLLQNNKSNFKVFTDKGEEILPLVKSYKSKIAQKSKNFYYLKTEKEIQIKVDAI